MTDLNFTCNVLTGIKGSFEDYDGCMRWLTIMKKYIDNAYKQAYWQGAYDYVCFICGVTYTVKEEYKLPELTYTPGYFMGATKEQREHAFNNAMSNWLAYNIITEGCNSVC